MTLTYGSICSGIEAASVAWEPLGFKPLWFSEIEAFPNAVLAHHWPSVPNLGDMTRLGGAEAPDILVGGTPCFTAGHMILTSTGYRQIQDICIGDLVVTHTGQLKRVLRTGFKNAEVGLLSANGLPRGITCTSDHPFRSAGWRMQNTKRNGVYCRVEHLSEPEWIPANKMGGKQWCALTQYEIEQPTIQSTKFDEKTAMYVAGMYLGDGHVRGCEGKNKKAVVLSLNSTKLEKFLTIVDRQQVTVVQERTSHRVHIYDTLLAEWLVGNFGSLAHSKHIPAWCLCNQYRDELLQGYIDTDGSKHISGYTINTVSKALAYGVTDLFNACAYVASVALVETPDITVIEGQTVNQKDYYRVRAFTQESSRKSRVRYGYLLRAVRGFKSLSTDTVFNIEVEGDHSYIVEGAVVHNCQSFSVAGRRRGMEDDRGQLTIKYVELIDAVDRVRADEGKQPVIAVWENVPGVLSSKDNAFGCFLGALAGAEELEPPRDSAGKSRPWPKCGVVFGPVRTIAWRILDAQYFGMAQRRRRVFLIASARDDFHPAQVLFEFDGVRRDTPPSRSKGESATAYTESGFARFIESGVAGTLRRMGGSLAGGSESLLVTHGTQDPIVNQDLAHTLGRNSGQENAVFSIQSNIIGRKHHNGGNGLGALEDTAPTLTRSDRHAVAYTMTVRRLTPVECERLQGFPDDYTLIPYRGKIASDGLRYAAIGNSKAVPCVRWLGTRVLQALRKPWTMGDL